MSAEIQTAETSYVLGHSERELVRLRQQAAFFADMTRDILVRAGVSPGMTVLDVGCGIGDVTLVAAELVGPQGRVIGIDHSPGALAIANTRARAEQRPYVSFERAAIEAFDDYQSVDAVVGRFILLHLRNPAAALEDIIGRTNKGTLISFMELDLSTAASQPELPLLTRALDWIREVYRRSGGEPDMGSMLAPTFQSARLSPEVASFTRTGSGAETASFDFVAESIRSLLPNIEKLGIATADEVDIETLRERLIAGATAEHRIYFPRFVGAWARS